MKNNLALVEHAMMALAQGWAYVLGTIGRFLSENILNEVIRRLNISPDNIAFIRANSIGKRSVDCASLIKSLLWWDNGEIRYNPSIDFDADTLYSLSQEKGAIGTIPEIPGLIVYFRGHVGIYIGNSEVIEARGTKYGVVKTKLKDRPWTAWFKFHLIEYVTPDKKTHWAKEHRDYLISDNKIILHEEKYDQNITRGETMAITAQIVARYETIISDLRAEIEKIKKQK